MIIQQILMIHIVHYWSVCTCVSVFCEGDCVKIITVNYSLGSVMLQMSKLATEEYMPTMFKIYAYIYCGYSEQHTVSLHQVKLLQTMLPTHAVTYNTGVDPGFIKRGSLNWVEGKPPNSHVQLSTSVLQLYVAFIHKMFP